MSAKRITATVALCVAGAIPAAFANAQPIAIKTVDTCAYDAKEGQLEAFFATPERLLWRISCRDGKCAVVMINIGKIETGRALDSTDIMDFSRVAAALDALARTQATTQGLPDELKFPKAFFQLARPTIVHHGGGHAVVRAPPGISFVFAVNPPRGVVIARTHGDDGSVSSRTPIPCVGSTSVQ